MVKIKKVSIEEFLAELSTNAMGIETRIQSLVALLDDNNSIEIDGTICKNESDIRKVLQEKEMIND